MKRVLLLSALSVLISGATPAKDFAISMTYDGAVAIMFPEYAGIYFPGEPFLPPSVRIQPLKATKDAAARAVEIIRDSGQDDLVCAVAYATAVDWVEQLTYDHNRVRAKIRGANKSLNASTNLHLGIAACRAELVSTNGRAGAAKVMVLMTDGNSSVADALAAAQLAVDQGITIHTVGLGSNVDQTLLEDIAAMGGGQAIFILNNTDPAVYGPQLETVFKNLAEDVQYTLIG